MKKILDIVEKFDNGSKFVRADLHIHSYKGSYDVESEDMTPQNIVDKSIKNGLSFISITDHNSISNVKEAIEYTEDKNILVVPGVELSTTQGHLLVYFSNYDDLNKYYLELNISEDLATCDESMTSCLNKLEQYDAFGIAAHIDVNAGFELYVSGYTPHKQKIVTHPKLFAMEIKNISNYDWYSDFDDNSERKHFFRERREKLDELNQIYIPKVMSSDAHSLNSIGINDSGRNKMTRIKVDMLSFSSLKTALQDYEARIRLEEVIPDKVPYFYGMILEGGFLKDQTVKFSKNLNCIIGGRGTGKSTFIESIRVASGNFVNDSKVDCEIWPDKISLIYQDEVGTKHFFQKNKLEQLVNISNFQGIQYVNIESYGQGETAEKIKNSDRNPQILLDFFNELLPLKELYNTEYEILSALKNNTILINQHKKIVEDKDDTLIKKRDIEQKIDITNKTDVKSILERETGLAKEREFRKLFVENLRDLIKKYRSIFDDKQLFEDVINFDETSILKGNSEFKSIKTIIVDFQKTIKKLESELILKTNDLIPKIKPKVDIWKQKDQEVQDEIDSLRNDLEKQGIKVDMVFLKNISIEYANINTKLKKIELSETALIDLNKERKELLEKRDSNRNEIFKKRKKYKETLNKNLRGAVEGFSISVKFKKDFYSTELVNLIKEIMNWRSKAEVLCSHISTPLLLEIIEKNDFEKLVEIKDSNDNNPISEDSALLLINRLLETQNKLRLEQIRYDDLPEIHITQKDETGVFILKKISHLSLGQQQSVLLAILIHSESRKPLLIDQPEDNLDSEFIYKTLVKNLRKVKEFRQVILVTHNANIAVLGDADLIIPLKTDNLSSQILGRGAIDSSDTRKIACDILEGSEKAFLKRKEMYGI